MHCIHQDAIAQKALDKQKKFDNAAAAKKASTAKKNAKTVVDSLTAPMLLFEEEIRKLEKGGPSYLLESATMLLARVKTMVSSATDDMLGGDKGIEWDMEEVKLTKLEMISKMRNL